MQHWRSPSASASVNKVDSGNRRSFQPTQRRKGPGKRGKLNSSGSNIKDPSECLSCGKTGHPRSQCKYRNYTCHSCGKVGHISEAFKGKPQKVHQLEGSEPPQTSPPDDSVDPVSLSLYNLSSGQQGIEIPVELNGTSLLMELRRWCRRLSYFRRNLEETLQWHTPHAVQYSPTCIHRTPTQGTRVTYCTPKVPRTERRCPTSCCLRLRPIPFWKRLAVPNKTRLDEDLQYSRIGDRPPTGRGFPVAQNYPKSP